MYVSKKNGDEGTKKYLIPRNMLTIISTILYVSKKNGDEDTMGEQFT